MFSAVHLRSVLSGYCEGNPLSAWVRINSDSHKLVKQGLFEVLSNEQDKNVRNVLCDLIGELGATIQGFDQSDKKKLGEEGIQWQELMPNLKEYLSSGKNHFIVSALKILANLFTYAGDDYVEHADDLWKIFQTNLNNDDIQVKAAALEAFGSFVETVDSKDARKFTELIPDALRATVIIVSNNEDLVEKKLFQ